MVLGVGLGQRVPRAKSIPKLESADADSGKQAHKEPEMVLTTAYSLIDQVNVIVRSLHYVYNFYKT